MTWQAISSKLDATWLGVPVAVLAILGFAQTGSDTFLWAAGACLAVHLVSVVAVLIGARRLHLFRMRSPRLPALPVMRSTTAATGRW